MQTTEIKDILLPAVIVSVVGIMIFPMPSVVLDALLTCNISFALVLLISAVYLAEPQKFTSLPTILLLATLFRLGLNIATTRQILSGSEVPDIILTFGGFVVGGNLIVGIVIFAIITLVQFLVIAKGAERVAEVAARFTLDAMPGKQMSIDADIRAGILSVYEARERRRELQVESKLFGALDGAMKFVKGDAVAGMLITAINITAGFLVGVTQQGLGFAEAAKRFTLFTIGDGLVSQIPALLVAVAAGIAVTRVSDNENLFLGRDMFGQLAREPQALGTSALVLAGLSFVPGMPMLSFLAMSGVLAIGARSGSLRRTQTQVAEAQAGFKPVVASKILLRTSHAAALALREDGSLVEKVRIIRKQLFDTLGVLAPDVQFQIDEARTDVWIAIELHGSVARVVEISEHLESSERISVLTAQALQNVIYSAVPELMDDTHTRTLLETHQAVAEDLINSVVPEQIRITALTALLRELVKENVSIKNLPGILQAVAESHGITGDPQRVPHGATACTIELLSSVRAALRRTITCAASDADGKIHAWVVSASFEKELLDTFGAGASLNPQRTQQLVSLIQSDAFNVRVLLAPLPIRRFLAEQLFETAPALMVLAPNELLDAAEVDLQGELELPHQESDSNVVELDREAA